MRVVGIDPGVKGAIGLVSSDGEVRVEDLPILQEGKKKTINPYVFSDMLWEMKPDVVVIENVAARPGQGVSSMFNFGYGAGILYGAAAALQVPVVFVSPAMWKRAMRLNSRSKDESRSLATRTFPKLAQFFKRVKDDGRAEAVLIAQWRLQTTT